MTKKKGIFQYLDELEKLGIQSVPLEEPDGFTKGIEHLCTCGVPFTRSPRLMLAKTATGVCDDCHKKVKRYNKLKDGIDNGYYAALKNRKHSLPLNRSDYVDRHTAIIHLCNSCDSTYYKIPAKALRPNSLGVCTRCGIDKKACAKIVKGLKRFLTSIEKNQLLYISGYPPVSGKLTTL